MVVPTQPVPEFGFQLGDVVPTLRYGLMIVGKLKLNDYTMLVPEKILASGKKEFPHPHKAFVIERGDPVPVPQKTHPPVEQCLGVVAAHALHVENFQPGGLCDAEKLGSEEM